jgi:hypothetical protein
MNPRITLLTLLILTTQIVKSQTAEKKETLFGVTFSGLIKTDFIFDTRQTINIRDGSLLFYPDSVKLDAEGKDINAKSSFNILSVQTKITMNIKGPDALGAKTSGLIEAEFFGNVNPNINVFRLRHAYVKLDWQKTELLVGQFWHPMYEVNCSPEVISADAGLPFKVYARNPQIRVTRSFGRFKVILAALTQVDFVSNGPEGPSSKYLRNSILPEMDLQVQYGKITEQTGREFQIGAGIDYLLLTPRITSVVTTQNAYDTVINSIVVHNDAKTATYITNSHSGAFSANIFTKIKNRKVTVKIGGVYSGNGFALSMLGGYAAKGVTNAEKGFVDYANINTISFWTDMTTNGTMWQVGLFGGYSKNLGAGTEVKKPYYSRSYNIDYLFRLAPRVLLTVNKLRFAGEVEYSAAGYGNADNKANVIDASLVGNFRFLLSAYYLF